MKWPGRSFWGASSRQIRPEVRFRKEWQALRANEARIRETEAEQHPVDLFLQGKELERAA